MTSQKKTDPAEEPIATEEEGEPVPEEIKQLHPIAFFLAKQLQPGEAGHEFAPVPDEVILEMGEYLVGLPEQEHGEAELVHAAHTIASFVVGNKKDSPDLAAQVQQLLEMPVVIDAMKKWSVSADPEQVKKIAENFGHFAGLDTSKKAPKVGEEKPEGSVDLNALNFPKRL